MSTGERKPKPYVGVSGVMTPEMQGRLITAAEQAGIFTANRVLALGVKAVHKTQFLDIENKYGNEWYPVGAQAFSNALDPGLTSEMMLEVAQIYLDIEHVANPNYRKDFMTRIRERGCQWLKAVQFDMLPWYNDSQMLDFLEQLKKEQDVTILLQCHDNAMTELGPRGVVQHLGRVANSIDYLLFDASHGTGKRLDTMRLAPFLEEASASEEFQSTSLAVAGGLNAAIVREDLPALLKNYPDLSWDAEGQLHPYNSEGKRPLDGALAKEYLEASGEVITNFY